VRPGRPVHAELFHDEVLVAVVTVDGGVPAQRYEIDGTRYQAISYTEVTTSTGERGYRVHVALSD
jgi:hypothetical protein